MRITERMFKFDSIRHVNSAEEESIELQKKLSSGLEVSKPSDDPLRYVTAMRFRSIVRSKEQHLRNISDARGHAENNDAAVERIRELLQRARTLLLQAGNETFTTADLRLTAKEMRQSLESLIQFGNSEGPEGKIFGGSRTRTDPFEAVRDANGDVTNVIYRGNATSTQKQIADGSLVDLNLVGSKFFQVDPDTRASSFSANFAGQTLANSGFPAGDQTGFFQLQGKRVSFNTATDSLLSVANRINEQVPEMEATVEGSLIGTATVVDASAATAATAGSVLINGVSVTIAAGASLNSMVSTINAVTGQTGVTASAAQVAGGFALQLDGGVTVDDVTPNPRSNAFQVLGVTSSASSPANLTSRNALAYRLQLATREPDQIFSHDEGSAQFLKRMGLADGTSNTPADNGAGTNTDTSLFSVFINAISDLDNGRFSNLRGDRLAEIDRGLAHVDDVSSDVAGLVKRLENTQFKEEGFILQAKEVISVNEDLDIAKAISDLRQSQLKLEAALGAASNVPVTNLLQFL
ncbi:MAG: flagellar hook-associated protein FlgL [Candidatus Hydrogenedentota bacterium]